MNFFFVESERGRRMLCTSISMAATTFIFRHSRNLFATEKYLLIFPFGVLMNGTPNLP